MLFNIETVVSKNDGWKLVSGKGIDGITIITEASANRTDKNGVVWAQFDSIVEGGSIEADPWKSPQGKQYLFAPKARSAPKAGGFSGAGSKAAQERKDESIEKMMDRKEAGILVAAAMRDSTLLTIAFMKDAPFTTEDDLQATFKRMKEWYLKEWANTEKALDIPFK